MKVKCALQYVELANDEGHDALGVFATCTRCEYREESFGTFEAAVRRCLVLLREKCPRNERNFYGVDEGSDVQ